MDVRVSISWLCFQLLPILSRISGANAGHPVPRFANEPPSSVVFLSRYGAIVPCSLAGGEGQWPDLRVSWQVLAGHEFVEATSIPGIRLIKEDGSLAFPPFMENEFQANIHSNVYRCLASYRLGVIGSRRVRVKAVIEKPIDVRVSEESGRKGSQGVTLRCLYPPDYRGYVTVSAWFSDGLDGQGLILLPPSFAAHDTEGKFAQRKHHVLSSGDLFVSNIEEKDGNRRYRCQVINQLTGERTDSLSYARLSIIEKPSISFAPQSTRPQLNQVILAKEGDPLLIACPLDGYPKPDFAWYQVETKGNDGGQLKPIKGYHKLSSQLWYIPRVSASDMGKVVCEANNSLGSSRFQIELQVKSSLKMLLSPSNPNPNIGEDITLNCTLIESSLRIKTDNGFIDEVVWYQNMKRLPFDHRLRKITDSIIHIRSFRFSDNGIYQCFLHRRPDPSDPTLDGAHYQEEWLHGDSVLVIKEHAPSLGTVFSEQIKIANSDLSLKCLALGIPPPAILWRIDGAETSNSHRMRTHSYANPDGRGTTSYLNISSLSVQDGGLYECRATNIAGSLSHKARINIMGSLSIRAITNVTAVIGEPFTLQCPYTGYPVDEIYFLKENRRLPLDDRHTVMGLGKIRMNMVTKEDSGAYKCVVLSLNGEQTQGTVIVKVVAAPVMSPFMFPDNLEEGMRTSVVCSVISGDSPISIKWFKDGQAIEELRSMFQVVSITEFVASLIISRVDRYFSGNYTCKASNEIASVNFTGSMQVKARPSWILKPASKSGVSGSAVRLDCAASGYPEPVIRWKVNKSQGQSQGPLAILSSPRIHVLENGSLIIKAVQMEDQGSYFCEASNGVGKQLETSADLLVYEPPQVRPKSAHITIKRMERTEMSCRSQGSHPISFQWFKNEEAFSSRDHYMVREEMSIKDKVSIVSINVGSRNDSGLFSCVASNYYGLDKATVNLVVQEPPDVPSDLRALEISSRSVSLSWSISYTGNSPISGYEVDHKRSSESWLEGKTMVISANSVNSVVVSNLSPMTSYIFRIRAENDLGKSDFSPEIPVTTTMEAPQFVPQNVTCVPLDSKSLRIGWSVPNTLKNQFTEGFYIGYKVVTSLDPFTYKTMHSVLNGNEPRESGLKLQKKFEYVIDLLRKSTRYSVIVQAFNSKGAGPSSPEITVETYANDPPKAPTIRIEGSTFRTATISWTLPGIEGEAVEGFILSFRNENDHIDNWETIRLSRQQRKHILANLLCGNKYAVKINGFNEVGAGESSDEAHFSTEGRPPIAPEKQIFIRSNITSISLKLDSWRDGGCQIVNFIVQYKPKTQPEWVLLSNHILPQQETVIIRELFPGTWHDLLILVRNDAGTTEANYLFATLTVTGATVAPLLLSDAGLRSPFDTVLVLVPSICAIIVLILVGGVAIYILFCKPRGDDTQSEPYGRQGNDTVSLNSYNKTPKAEPIYDQQRVQVYYPAVYGTPANERQLARNMQPFDGGGGGGVGGGAGPEYGFTIESARILSRKPLHDHVYDVPHRFRKDASACSTPNDEFPINSALLWTKTGSKEIILEDIKSETCRDIQEILHNR